MISYHSIIGTENRHPGYTLLFSVIAIGTIASTVVASLLMLSTTASQVGISNEQGVEAFALAHGCMEYALEALRTSTNYTGNETKTLSTGVCEILTVGGTGNNNRMICTEGRSGNVTRRLEVIVRRVLPTTLIDSWQEVSTFTICQ